MTSSRDLALEKETAGKENACGGKAGKEDWMITLPIAVMGDNGSNDDGDRVSSEGNKSNGYDNESIIVFCCYC